MPIQKITFTGMTNSFSKCTFEKYSTMQKVANNFQDKSQIAGKLPQDIVSIIVGKNDNPNDAIKYLLSEFGECANLLQKVFLIQGDFAKNYVINNDIESIKNLRAFRNQRSVINIVERIFHYNPTVIEQGNIIGAEVEKRLTEACKKVGLIPENGKVAIRISGQGSYGLALELNFLDEKKQEIVHGKIMKVFPLSQEENEASNETRIAMRTLYTLICQDSVQIDQSAFNECRQAIKEAFYSPSSDEFKRLRNIRLNLDMEDIHGFLPESNRGLFINRTLGRKVKSSNYVPFYYTDLRNNYFITEKMDRTLPYPTRQIPLYRFGLINTDGNSKNRIQQRLIDYGGLQTLSDREVAQFERGYNLLSSWS